MGAALLSLALVAGCGGGGGSVGSTPAPTPLPTPTPSPTATPSSAFLTAEYNRSTGPSQHGVLAAWTQGYNGSGVTIGIVDSGIDTASPEFTGRIADSSKDVAGNRGLSNADSDHGTNVAMVAAAARDNTGIVGIAYNSTIAMYRADSPGSCATADPTKPDSGCTFFDSAIASGINSAVAGGAKVINLSLGGSAPNSQLRAAITNAANNGVVVVVSAGNDGDSTDPTVDPNNPDPFASGLRAAGNGNVIIAGSVDANNVISGFANKAGSDASWYLSARGERVCCVYENGVMKVVTNSDGSRSVYVISGTSFSAPQIAGAAALLRQAFPTLTAVQVVDLLLRTARDGGAAGTDAIYGRGILDITAAFAPQGATSLAGSTVAMPLGDSTAVTSAPMGDAGSQTGQVKAVMLDSFGRAYQVDLAAGVRTAQVPARLGPALENQVRPVALGNDRVSLAFSVDARGHVARMPWNGQLRLSREDAEAARVLAARAVLRIAPGSQLAFAFSQGSDGLVAQLQGRSQPAFLIARGPTDDVGFGRNESLSLAWRKALGPWGVSLGAEHGAAMSAAPVISGGAPLARTRLAPADRFSVTLDRQLGQLGFTAGASWLRETRSLLGAQFSDGFGAQGASTLFLDAGGEWHMAPGWRIAAAWRSGFARARTGGMIAPGSRLTSSAWSFDLAREGLTGPADSLALRVAQPLRVESGGLSLNLPVAYSYETLQPTFAAVPLSLAPRGREIDTELAWRGPLLSGVGLVSLFYRKDPGHFASLPDDKGAAVTWSKQF
ncbi:MAG: S8 family peptidase [Novosphingobium sp.]